MQSKELFQSTFRFLDFCSRRIRRNCTHLLLKKIALATIKAHNKNKMDIKSKDTKKDIKELMETVIDKGLSDKNLYNFYKTKK